MEKEMTHAEDRLPWGRQPGERCDEYVLQTIKGSLTVSEMAVTQSLRLSQNICSLSTD